MTKLSDAKLIVPEGALWVAINEDLFEPHMEELDWSSMLNYYGVSLPTSAVKVGLLTEVLRKGKVCRPIDAYINFVNQPITVVKGY